MRKRRNWAFEIGIVVLAVAAGVGFSLRPWQAFLEQRQVRDDLKADMKEAEARSEELARERARADSALGREERARRQGLVRPGEIPIESN